MLAGYIGRQYIHGNSIWMGNVFQLICTMQGIVSNFQLMNEMMMVNLKIAAIF
jgi:hypothetical protein